MSSTYLCVASPDTHEEVDKVVVYRPYTFRAHICNLQNHDLNLPMVLFYQNEAHSYIVPMNTIMIIQWAHFCMQYSVCIPNSFTKNKYTWDVSASWLHSCRNIFKGDECNWNTRFFMNRKLNKWFVAVFNPIVLIVLGLTRDQLWIFQASRFFISEITYIHVLLALQFFLHVLVSSFYSDQETTGDYCGT